MKAVVFYGTRDLRLENVPEPQIQEPTDAIVRLTTSAICGSDIHLTRGTLGELHPGTIPGHEGVGVIEALGADVRNFSVGDRVIISPTIACGNCVYCRSGYYSQCDTANPRGPSAAPAFLGSPLANGGFNGLLAQKARVPFAHTGLMKLPSEITDEQAVLLCDVAPTGYFAAELAEISHGDTVAVFGCGATGLFAIASAKMLGAGRVFAIDNNPERLKMAQQQGAEAINFESQSPSETINKLTDGIGVDRAIDTLGVSAESNRKCEDFSLNYDDTHQPFSTSAPDLTPNPQASLHDQALCWAVGCLAKAGTLAIIGSYSPDNNTFPIATALQKSLSINMGNCPHQKYIPKLIALTLSRRIDPAAILGQIKPITDSTDGLNALDQQQCGWIKIELLHQSNPSEAMENNCPTEEEDLDEAIAESFPASDPPSMTTPKH